MSKRSRSNKHGELTSDTNNNKKEHGNNVNKRSKVLKQILDGPHTRISNDDIDQTEYGSNEQENFQ